MGSIFDNNFYATELKRFSIDYTAVFGHVEDHDSNKATASIDKIQTHMLDNDFDRFYSTKRRNQKYLKDKDANEAFVLVQKSFSNISVIVIFDAVATYFEIEHSVLWKSLNCKLQELLLKKLKVVMNNKLPQTEKEIKMKNDGVYEPKFR